MRHCCGERHTLGNRHPPEVDGHRERGHLVVPDRPVGQAGDEALDIAPRQFSPVTLGTDDLLREKRHAHDSTRTMSS